MLDGGWNVMFCPRCGTENKSEQRYCRHCGLSLPAVRLALEGQVDEAVRKYKKSESALDWGFVILLIGGLNALINAFFHAWPTAIISGMLGIALGLILIFIGLSRMGRANKILNPPEKRDEQGSQALKGAEDGAGARLPPAPATEELKDAPARSPSVIENTTMKLKRPE